MAKARNAEEAKRAQERADMAAANLAKEAERRTLQAQSIVAAPIIASGMRTRQIWKFEVTHAQSVYVARPELCDPPTVRISAVNVEIKNGMRSCPGLRIWQETIAEVRP